MKLGEASSGVNSAVLVNCGARHLWFEFSARKVSVEKRSYFEEAKK